MNLYCLGPENSYSDILAKQVFSTDYYEYIYRNSFTEIACSLDVDADGLGILVVENSITTNIHESINLIFERDFNILGEAYLLITLHLIGNSQSELDGIKTVISKLPAINQSSDFLKTKKITVEESTSTAAGVDKVLADSSVALIGSINLARSNTKLKILRSEIGNIQLNKTRFVFVSRTNKKIFSDASTKMTVIFKIPHKVGSLANILDAIATAKGNLTKIESKPIPGTNLEYQFWVDIEYRNVDEEKILMSIMESTSDHKIIGKYPKGITYES